MQTVKPRARYLPALHPMNKFCDLWEVTHPGTAVKMWCNLPHDAAVSLLAKYVLPNQVEPVLS